MHLDQVHIVQFAVGFCTGLILLSALFHVRAFTEAMLAVAALALAYVLWTEGVPGLVLRATRALQHIRENDLFVKGAVCGKFIAGLIKWRRVRRYGDWRS
jgi:hypothetical protein